VTSIILNSEKELKNKEKQDSDAHHQSVQFILRNEKAKQFKEENGFTLSLHLRPRHTMQQFAATRRRDKLLQQITV